jgi:hypothetical protein
MLGGWGSFWAELARNTFHVYVLEGWTRQRNYIGEVSRRGGVVLGSCLSWGRKYTP